MIIIQNEFFVFLSYSHKNAVLNMQEPSSAQKVAASLQHPFGILKT